MIYSGGDEGVGIKDKNIGVKAGKKSNKGLQIPKNIQNNEF